MARKTRKKTAARRRKKSTAAKGGRKHAAKKKFKMAPYKPKRRKPQPPSFADKITAALDTLVDTIKGTDKLRNKLEPRATSETE
jgi:hypothetical protein